MEPAQGAVGAVYGQLAELMLGAGRYDRALTAYQHLYKSGLRDRATLLHYGFCLEHTGNLEEAVARYREAIALEPDFLEAHVDLAGVLWRLSDFEGSLAHAQHAVRINPDHPFAVRILGTALLNLNRLDEAQVQLRRALELMPHMALAQLDLAFTLLAAGRLEEGWAWYEKRWNDTTRLKRPPYFNPALEWQGPGKQPLQGKRIALYVEQGLGDVIQMVRYLPLLQADGAEVFCVLQPELTGLLEHSFPGVQCLTPERNFTVDWHAALLELPMHYGTTLENIPAQGPYLRAPQDKAAQWRDWLAPLQGKLKVGIAWSGFRGQQNNRNRAFYLSELQPLMRMPGVQCFSLQKSDAGPYTDFKPSDDELIDFTGEWHDFTDSAAMLENLDLVITVDTSIAHLAGALGKPVWVLLGPNADWRWLLEREDSPWYPSMRLFRRGFDEKRSAQVQRVMQALEAELAAR